MVDVDAYRRERERAAALQEALGVGVQASQLGYAIVDYDALDRLLAVLKEQADRIERLQREATADAVARSGGGPLRDAIAVLERIDLATLSVVPETEDAGNRVAVALGYLRKAIEVEPQAQSKPREPLAAIAELLRRDGDSASEASRLLTEQDAGVVRAWLSGEEPGPGHAALDRLVAALVARDAELAEARQERDTWKREAFMLDAAGKKVSDERQALEAEVTQLRAALEATRTANESLAALNLDYLARESALERLAHDRGEALTDLLADVDGARWQIENYLGTTMEAGPLGCFNNLADSAARARKLLARVVPPEQAPTEQT